MDLPKCGSVQEISNALSTNQGSIKVTGRYIILKIISNIVIWFCKIIFASRGVYTIGALSIYTALACRKQFFFYLHRFSKTSMYIMRGFFLGGGGHQKTLDQLVYIKVNESH